jgi:hypothetical protein
MFFVSTNFVAESCILKNPTNIFASAKGTSVTINWTKNACANGYKIMYRAVGNPTWKYSTIPDTSSKTLYLLNYTTNYEYAIASLDSTTISNYSAIKYFTTLCQCDTMIMVVDSIGANGIKFLWVDDICGVRYRMQYRKVGSALWVTKVANDSLDTKIVTNLLANTTYKWRYRKECNLAGTYVSLWSNIWEFTTALPLLKPQVRKVVKYKTINR